MTTVFASFAARLDEIDVSALDRRGLCDLIAGVKRARSALDAAESRALAAVNALADGGAGAVDAARQAGACSQREARRRAWRAEALANMPKVSGALANGDITGEHADALARAAASTSAEAVEADEGLLAKAKSLPADLAARAAGDWAHRHQREDDREAVFRRQRSMRSHRTWTDRDGMFHSHAKLDSVTGAKVKAILTDWANRLRREHGLRDGTRNRSRGDGSNKSRAWQNRNADAFAAAIGAIAGPNGNRADAPTLGQAAPTDIPAGGQGQPGNPAGHASDPEVKPAGERQISRRARSQPGHDSDPSGEQGQLGNPAGHDSDPEVKPAGGCCQQDGTRLSAATATALPGTGRAGQRDLSQRNQILVIAETDAIIGGGSRCEISGTGPIPRSELERLACGADLFGALFDGNGLPLWHGRRLRTVSPQQWRVLLARDRGCVLCGADPAFCHAHHIVPWTSPARGRTDITNLALVCNRHHQHVHQNHLTLTRGADGHWTAIRNPAGRG